MCLTAVAVAFGLAITGCGEEPDNARNASPLSTDAATALPDEAIVRSVSDFVRQIKSSYGSKAY
jgi:hypothetical protein